MFLTGRKRALGLRAALALAASGPGLSWDPVHSGTELWNSLPGGRAVA